MTKDYYKQPHDFGLANQCTTPDLSYHPNVIHHAISSSQSLYHSFLAHLWCAYAMALCLSWIVHRAVGGVCVEHNYPKMWMD